MRSSSLSTIVCLAVAVIASPTPIDPSSLEARDTWSPPVRRDVFSKRSPEPEPEPIVVDKRSPFTLTPNNIPSSDSIGDIAITSSLNGNARLPFFLKRDGKLQARDIEALEARKAEIEQREVEELVRREAEEFARRESEEFARRESEDLARREAEELVAREVGGLQKRAAIEEIEARELELEMVKREYEEMFRREYEAEMQQREFVEHASRDIEAREPLSFTLPRNMAVSGRRLPFDLTVTLEARDFDDESTHIAKRDPQFNIASLISQLRGNATANAGGNTGTNNALSRLTALFGGNTGNGNVLSGLTTALNRFGFNFRREEELARELAAREPAPFPFSYAEATHMSKRDPQFNIASLISQLRGNATANAGGNTGSNSAASRLSALTNGRLANLFGGNGNANGLSGLTSALSRFGFNFRREEELARELAAREASPLPFSFKEDTVSRREPFDFDAFVKARRQEFAN